LIEFSVLVRTTSGRIELRRGRIVYKATVSSQQSAGINATAILVCGIQTHSGSFTLWSGADVKEWLYVAALHQSCMPRTRDNATISSVDVQRLLSSRYNIHISHAQGIQIVRQLSGGMQQASMSILQQGKSHEKSISKVTINHHHSSSESDPEEANVDSANTKSPPILAELEEYYDVVQMVAMLIIPNVTKVANKLNKLSLKKHHSLQGYSSPFASKQAYFQHWRKRKVQQKQEVEDNQKQKRASNSDTHGTPATSSRLPLADLPPYHVVYSLLEDGLALLLSSVPATDSDIWPPPINIPLIHSMLLECGEVERAHNHKLLQAMVEAAHTESGRLDVTALVQALTADLSAWPVGSEEEKTSQYHDIMGFETPMDITQEEQQQLSKKSDTNNHSQLEPRRDTTNDYDALTHKSVLTHTKLDFAIDAHSSVVVVMLIWLFYVMNALSYFSLLEGIRQIKCVRNGHGHEFGCGFASYMKTW
jgi:hypothetical protein